MSLPWLVRSHPYRRKMEKYFYFSCCGKRGRKKIIPIHFRIDSIIAQKQGCAAEAFRFHASDWEKSFRWYWTWHVRRALAAKHMLRGGIKSNSYMAITTQLSRNWIPMSYGWSCMLTVRSPQGPGKFSPWTNSYRISINTARCWESFAFSKNHLIAETIQFRPWCGIKVGFNGQILMLKLEYGLFATVKKWHLRLGRLKVHCGHNQIVTAPYSIVQKGRHIGQCWFA